MKSLRSRRLRIRGAWWKLVMAAPPPEKLLAAGFDLDSRGLCDPESRTLWATPDKDAYWTVLHEVTHACLPELREDVVEEIEDAQRNALEPLLK